MAASSSSDPIRPLFNGHIPALGARAKSEGVIIIHHDVYESTSVQECRRIFRRYVPSSPEGPARSFGGTAALSSFRSQGQDDQGQGNEGLYEDEDFPATSVAVDGPPKKKEGPGKCFCGIPASQSTTKRGPNKGKGYFHCSLHPRRCRFFQWAQSMAVDFMWNRFPPPAFHFVSDTGFRAEDLQQGKLGDCWFLSALSCVAERPDLIMRLFPDHVANKKGIYRVNLFMDGKWRGFCVDDRLPCLQGSLCYSQAKEMQLWVPILEKAYAKAHGSYRSISGGEIAEAFTDLTGCPTETYNFDHRDFNPMDFWETLQEYRSHRLPMGCATNNSNSLGKMGLVALHAYSILDIREYPMMNTQCTRGGGVSGFMDNTLRLIQIRNPHGKGEWKGAWSDNDVKWRKLNLGLTTGVNDGTFWMSYEDFLMGFQIVDVCLAYESLHCKSFPCEFPAKKCADRACSTVLKITTAVDTIVYAMVCQPTKRGAWCRADRKKSYKPGDLGLICTYDDGRVMGKMFGIKRTQHLRVELKAGETCMITPLALGFPQAVETIAGGSKNGSFVTRLISKVPIHATEMHPALAGSCGRRGSRLLHQLLLTQFFSKKRDGGAYFKSISNRGGGGGAGHPHMNNIFTLQNLLLTVPNAGAAADPGAHTSDRILVHNTEANAGTILMHRLSGAVFILAIVKRDCGIHLEARARGMGCRTAEGLLTSEVVKNQAVMKYRSQWRTFTIRTEIRGSMKNNNKGGIQLIAALFQAGADWEFGSFPKAEFLGVGQCLGGGGDASKDKKRPINTSSNNILKKSKLMRTMLSGAKNATTEAQRGLFALHENEDLKTALLRITSCSTAGAPPRDQKTLYLDLNSFSARSGNDPDVSLTLALDASRKAQALEIHETERAEVVEKIMHAMMQGGVENARGRNASSSAEDPSSSGLGQPSSKLEHEIIERALAASREDPSSSSALGQPSSKLEHEIIERALAASREEAESAEKARASGTSLKEEADLAAAIALSLDGCAPKASKPSKPSPTPTNNERHNKTPTNNENKPLMKRTFVDLADSDTEEEVAITKKEEEEPPAKKSKREDEIIRQAAGCKKAGVGEEEAEGQKGENNTPNACDTRSPRTRKRELCLAQAEKRLKLNLQCRKAMNTNGEDGKRRRESPEKAMLAGAAWGNGPGSVPHPTPSSSSSSSPPPQCAGTPQQQKQQQGKLQLQQQQQQNIDAHKISTILPSGRIYMVNGESPAKGDSYVHTKDVSPLLKGDLTPPHVEHKSPELACSGSGTRPFFSLSSSPAFKCEDFGDVGVVTTRKEECPTIKTDVLSRWFPKKNKSREEENEEEDVTKINSGHNDRPPFVRPRTRERTTTPTPPHHGHFDNPVGGMRTNAGAAQAAVGTTTQYFGSSSQGTRGDPIILSDADDEEDDDKRRGAPASASRSPQDDEAEEDGMSHLQKMMGVTLPSGTKNVEPTNIRRGPGMRRYQIEEDVTVRRDHRHDVQHFRADDVRHLEDEKETGVRYNGGHIGGHNDGNNRAVCIPRNRSEASIEGKSAPHQARTRVALESRIILHSEAAMKHSEEVLGTIREKSRMILHSEAAMKHSEAVLGTIRENGADKALDLLTPKEAAKGKMNIEESTVIDLLSSDEE